MEAHQIANTLMLSGGLFLERDLDLDLLKILGLAQIVWITASNLNIPVELWDKIHHLVDAGYYENAAEAILAGIRVFTKTAWSWAPWARPVSFLEIS